MKLLAFLAVLATLANACLAQSTAIYEFLLQNRLTISSPLYCIAREYVDPSMYFYKYSAGAHMWVCNQNIEDQRIRFIPDGRPRNNRVYGRLELGNRPGLPQLCVDVTSGDIRYDPAGEVINPGSGGSAGWVNLWECNGTNAQQWTIIREVANGVEAYKISPVTALDLCLTVRPSTTGIQNENFIRLFPCADLKPSPNLQSRGHWTFLPAVSGSDVYNRIAHKYSDMRLGTPSRLNATHSILWVSNHLIEALPEPPSFLLQTVINTQYCVARNNVPGFITSFSAPAHMWACNRNIEDQRIRFLPLPQLRNGNLVGMLQLGKRMDLLDLCFDIPNGDVGAYAPIRLWECNDTNAQIFILQQDTLDGHERYRLTPAVRPDLCVTIRTPEVPMTGEYYYLGGTEGMALVPCESLSRVEFLKSHGHWMFNFGASNTDNRVPRVVLLPLPEFGNMPAPNIQSNEQILNGTHAIRWVPAPKVCDMSNPSLCPSFMIVEKGRRSPRAEL